MNACIISIGNEILIGKTVNTNATFIADRLTRLGIVIGRVITIADSEIEISSTVREALGQARIIIITGGLGPTRDDITKKAVAGVFGKKIVVNQRLLDVVNRKFRKYGYDKMPESNISQAEIPEDAIAMPNPRGTAPGIIMQQDERYLFMLPGVPVEMKGLMLEEVIPFIKKNLLDGLHVLVRTIRTAGIGESRMAEQIDALLPENQGISLAYLPSFGHVDVRLTVLTKDREEGEKLIFTHEKIITGLLKDYIYGYDEETLAGSVGDLLNQKGYKIATAESCTGGLIGKKFTDVSGSSEFFQGGIIAYDNSVKKGLLGISEENLVQYGAVSEQVAVQMAEGVCKAAGADVGVSTTGIAGPTGGTKEKPVGLVYTAYCIKGKTTVQKLNMIGDREQVRERTAVMVLNNIRLLLHDKDIYRITGRR